MKYKVRLIRRIGVQPTMKRIYCTAYANKSTDDKEIKQYPYNDELTITLRLKEVLVMNFYTKSVKAYSSNNM